MSTFLDARTSQNASLANSIAIPILFLNTPQLFGQIGLQTAGAGANPRVQLRDGFCTITFSSCGHNDYRCKRYLVNGPGYIFRNVHIWFKRIRHHK